MLNRKVRLQAAYGDNIALFAGIAAEKQAHAQTQHHHTGKALLPQQIAWMARQTLTGFARSQGDTAQGDDASGFLHAAQNQQLQPHRPHAWVDKLRQKTQT